MALSRRTWLFTSLILPATGVVAIAAAVVTIALVPGDLKLILGWVAVLVVVGLGLSWNALAGSSAQHRRVAAARAEWVQDQPGATVVADGTPDAQDAELLRRHPWRVHLARGRARFTVEGTEVRAETWVMRAMGRSRVRREVVVAEAPTGAAYGWIALGAPVAPLLEPGWARKSAAAQEPNWLPLVRAKAAAYDGIVAGLAIGNDRVVVIGADDARIETMLQRARLVSEVVRIIAGQ